MSGSPPTKWNGTQLDRFLSRRVGGRGEHNHAQSTPGRPDAEPLPIWLRPLPGVEAAALLAGVGEPGLGLSWHPEYPMSETLDALWMIVGAHGGPQAAADGEPDWWLHQIVARGQVIGDAGFHGPPGQSSPRTVEIGYNVVGSMRRRGVATQACRLLLEQAWRDGADVVVAEADPSNIGSHRVLGGAGFVAEDERRYRISRPSAGAGGPSVAADP